MLCNDTQQGDFQLNPPTSGQQAAGVLFTAEAAKWDSNPANLPKRICFTSEVTPAYGTRSGGSAVWNGKPKPCASASCRSGWRLP
ncbi:hypothetical protein MTX78_13665 [Hymenobacter tibetensis]|uniref:Uncharacterized protein n=1 Tax=Hymenobacter tibetensis TaxID=497967 RepID=A0ABY4CVI3_9BACT|nr:hypothetical protein [Hymenobacter tibetensis]UOG73170.1 hypothetical protein MTX78_13665 [Hymenobacter tibetensis]